MILLLLACESEAPAAAAQPDVAYWTCPMHPAVKAEAPGQCPICGMDLTPVSAAQVATGEVIVDAERRGIYGIRTVAAERRPMARVLRFAGPLDWDTRRQRDVVVRVEGVAEGVRVAPGARVRAGDVLFSVRSLEFIAAQQDLLAAPSPSTRARLTTLGLTDAQVVAIESGAPLPTLPVVAPVAGVITTLDVVEGSPVGPWTAPARVAGADTVWMEATLSEADAALLSAGAPATLTLPSHPGRTFEGVVQPIPGGGVRVRIDNAGGALRSGLVAIAESTIPLGEALTVPVDAVIHAGRRRVVFVDAGEGRLVPREVVVGQRVGEEIAILSGLEPGEIVVSDGNFLVAADSRLRAPAAWRP